MGDGRPSVRATAAPLSRMWHAWTPSRVTTSRLPRLGRHTFPSVMGDCGARPDVVDTAGLGAIRLGLGSGLGLLPKRPQQVRLG
jgi:hypothetical protein